MITLGNLFDDMTEWKPITTKREQHGNRDHCLLKGGKGRIAIIDTEIIGRGKHRFPNLCCMKIAGYYKRKGYSVELVQGESIPEGMDRVYQAKVFTDTPDPFADYGGEISRGGTGYYYDKAIPLPKEIEHSMPDYHLYDNWLIGKKSTKFYTDYSIGYLTRGCFRRCPFCVNQKYSHAFAASPLSEFWDKARKKICLLDDNFLSYRGWRELMEELIATGRRFQFKQGLDERILDEERCKMLFGTNQYDGDYKFAFDNIRDYSMIESKLRLIRKYTGTSHIQFYVLCGFEGTDHHDIENIFRRIGLLFEYGVIPYVMRYQGREGKPYSQSRWAKLYNNIARWTNQPALCKKMSFREFCMLTQKYSHQKRKCAAMRSMEDFEKAFPDIAKKWFDIRFHKF